jgi:hypothetical protein
MAAIGCDVGQGYWLSRPLRPEALVDWMRGARSNPGRSPRGRRGCPGQTRPTAARS